MKDRKIENFCEYFPSIAARAVKYYEPNVYELLVKLEDGSSVLYDDVEKTIRRMPTDKTEMTEQACKKEFGFRLRKMMFRKNITQSELGEKTGISQVTLSNYINGKNIPGFYAVYKIVKALKCSMDELMFIDYNE